MPFTFVKEDWHSRESSIDDKFERTAKRIYKVRTAAPTVSGIIVQQATGIPRVWDLHPDDDGLQVKSVRAEQSSELSTLWIVTVEYSSKVEDEEKQAEDPLDRPAIIEWGTKEQSVSSQVDWNDPGVPLLNAAGQPFDPPPSALEYWDTLTITRNQPDYDRDLTRRFRGAVNSDDWYGGPAGTCKCTNITARQNKENDVFFWAVTYTFEVKEEVEEDVSPWLTQILNAGFEEWDAANEVWKKMNDARGQPVSQPVLLDKFGARLAFGEDPVILTFQFFTLEEFAELNLP